MKGPRAILSTVPVDTHLYTFVHRLLPRQEKHPVYIYTQGGCAISKIALISYYVLL
jgi:hypothetical protein